jgi:hypothetical protein
VEEFRLVADDWSCFEVPFEVLEEGGEEGGFCAEICRAGRLCGCSIGGVGRCGGWCDGEWK